MTHLLLTSIVADKRCQPRVRLEQSLVDEYAQAMTEGAAFPPLTVYQDGATHYLADGFHRYHAAREVGLDTIDCDVTPGTLRDAMLHAVSANATHGMRRTDLDKRRAVDTLLGDPEWSRWSNYEIADRCAVSESMVRSLRTKRSETPKERTYTTKHGTTATMNTERIGKRSSVAVAEPDDDEDYPEVAGELVDLSTGELLGNGVVSHTVAYRPPTPEQSPDERAAQALIEEYGGERAERIARAVLRLRTQSR